MIWFFIIYSVWLTYTCLRIRYERRMFRDQMVFWQEQASESREETQRVYTQFMHNMDFGEEGESEEEDDPLN